MMIVEKSVDYCTKSRQHFVYTKSNNLSDVFECKYKFIVIFYIKLILLSRSLSEQSLTAHSPKYKVIYIILFILTLITDEVK